MSSWPAHRPRKAPTAAGSPPATAKPYISHGSLGPSAGIARYDGARLTIWTHNQGVYPMRVAGGADHRPAGRGHRRRPRAGAGLLRPQRRRRPADRRGSDSALRRPGPPVRVQWRREDEFGAAPVGTGHADGPLRRARRLRTPRRLHGRDLEHAAHGRPRNRGRGERAARLPAAPQGAAAPDAGRPPLLRRPCSMRSRPTRSPQRERSSTSSTRRRSARRRCAALGRAEHLRRRELHRRNWPRRLARTRWPGAWRCSARRAAAPY